MSAFYNGPDFTLSLKLLEEVNALRESYYHSALRKDLAQGLVFDLF